MNQAKSLLLLALFLFASSDYYAQTPNKIAIIGGGIAGTSAAYYLRKADSTVNITLYEKEHQLGGNAYTVEVPNVKGEMVRVDVGPQYFCEGPWNAYIAFLDETIGLNNIPTESMIGSLLVRQQGISKPTFITPLNGSLRGEKLGNLLRFKRFNQAAYDVYQFPAAWKGKSIQDWVTTLKFSEQYKSEILYPFLAASLGTTVTDIKLMSVYEIVQLFGFRKPKLKNRFNIMEDGMGTLIQRIGEKLEQQAITIKLGANVSMIQDKGEKYIISFFQDGQLQVDTVDFVVLAVHADQAAHLIKNISRLAEMHTSLQQLPYFKANIVVHNDNRFIDTTRPAFMNIATDNNHEILYNTMNLSVISNRLNGIYKSWMSPDHLKDVSESGRVLYTKTFYHPYISTSFIAALTKLKLQNEASISLQLIGGWLHGIETQNSAVISAQNVTKSYLGFKTK